ncbi:MAG: tryptophan-rich sensory protein [Deltaproteobacteria bacterium]|uniref:Tryptophan-rich sensory protein n=1 Tax=Candidatus Zymogenus saltonus TaxID=2844893 RepID=A0A9D8KDV2_9DELT|nr:tryptophan-rich sensory protein [Candidatus Zymogenus saltonus]
MKSKDIVRLLGAVILCEGCGIIGSLFTAPSVPTWYASLTKPSFNPPDWIFSPVWIALFFLMGISLFLVIREGFKKREVKLAVWVFAVQLVLNVLWTLIFFGLKAPLAAFIEIILLWIAILVTIIRFFPISRLAGYLLIPYIAWVSFAALLNISIFILNS